MSFPINIWAAILDYLPAEDLFRLAQVDKQLNELVESNDNLWIQKCFYALGNQYYAVVLPVKSEQISFKQYFKELINFFSVPVLPGDEFEFNSVNVGKETWTRITSPELSRDVWNLVYTYPDMVVESAWDSQQNAYLNGVFCYKRNKIEYPKLHIDEPLVNQLNIDLTGMGYLPFSIWNKEEVENDGMSSNKIPMNDRQKRINIREFYEKEFMKCGFVSMLPSTMNIKKKLCSSDGNNSGNREIYTISTIVCSFLQPLLLALLKKQIIEFGNLHEYMVDVISKIWKPYYSARQEYYGNDEHYPNDGHNEYYSCDTTEKNDRVADDDNQLPNDQNLFRINVPTSVHEASNVNLRKADEKDVINLIYHFKVGVVSSSSAISFLKNVLKTAIEVIRTNTCDTGALTTAMVDNIDNFVQNVVAENHNKYTERTGKEVLIEDFNVGQLCTVFIVDNIIEASDPVLDVIVKLLFNCDYKFSELDSLDECEYTKKLIRRINLTEIDQNDHEANDVRLFVSKHHAVVVYEHIYHC